MGKSNKKAKAKLPTAQAEAWSGAKLAHKRHQIEQLLQTIENPEVREETREIIFERQGGKRTTRGSADQVFRRCFRRARRKSRKNCRHNFSPLNDAETPKCQHFCSNCGKKRTQHEWMAHPSIFFATCCYHCGNTHVSTTKMTNQELIQDPDEQLLRYLSWRRKARYLCNLHSLSLPLNFSDYGKVMPLLEQAGVRSNTSTLHVTLLEGVESSCQQFAGKVWDTLSQDSQCTVSKVHSIPTNQSHLRLVLANVEFDQSPQLLEGAPTIKLPQWPLHMALGTVLATNVDHALAHLHSALVGQKIATSPDHLQWLMAQKDTYWNRSKT